MVRLARGRPFRADVALYPAQDRGQESHGRDPVSARHDRDPADLLDIHTPRERMEIASVQRVDPRQMRWVVPLFGGYGFFGYYGYYFDLKTFEKVVVYASEWKNLVEIVDIYEQRYYVSCTQADELVALLQSE